MNITRNVFKRVCNVLCLVLALLSASCVNKISDEIQESNIPITFSTKQVRVLPKQQITLLKPETGWVYLPC